MEQVLDTTHFRVESRQTPHPWLILSWK